MSKLHTVKDGQLSSSQDLDGLQVVHDQNADALQAVRDQESDGLQAVYRDTYRGYSNYVPPYQTVKDEKAGTRKLCGLRATTFWLICVIVILIVGGGVGGGIGGWLASKKSDTATSTSTDICPSANGTTHTESLGPLQYRIICDSDFSGSGKETLASIVLATFNQCLSVCNTMNYYQNRTDVGCTYNVQGTGSQTPGTCWCLGGEDKTIVSNVGNVIAVPV